MTFAIVVTRVLVVVFALVGVIVNLAISSDIKRNRGASRLIRAREELSAAGLVDLEETARIDIRGARASAGAHAMFLILGLIEVGLPPPDASPILAFGLPLSRQLLALSFAILWDGIQALVVAAQVRNQVARISYRRRGARVPLSAK